MCCRGTSGDACCDGAGLHDREGTCSVLGLALSFCSLRERKTEKFHFSHPCAAKAPVPAQLHTFPGGCSVLGVLPELLCSGTVKTGFAFPESVLIQNEICKREALDEHLGMINVSLLS